LSIAHLSIKHARRMRRVRNAYIVTNTLSQPSHFKAYELLKHEWLRFLEPKETKVPSHLQASIHPDGQRETYRPGFLRLRVH
jgi:hypothetical protein